jgi:drug/metabolite transporter (DMT)-like permease
MSTLLAAPIFLTMMIFRGKLQELTNKAAWIPMLGTSLFLVAILHPVMAIGMSQTAAGNASIVGMVEVLYSFLFFGFFLRIEKYSKHAFFGAALMVFGALLLLFHGNFQPHLGDIILIGSLWLAPIGNFFQQQARKLVSTETLLFVRSFIGASLALFAGSFFVPWPSFANLMAVWPYMLVNALLIFGLQKIIWVESINRIPVAKALTLRSLTPAVTIFLAFFILHEQPNWWQILGFLPMAIGAYLILNKDFLHPHKEI